jgi:hypothetical protein
MITQTGDFNQASIDNFNSWYTTADILQQGSDLIASISQANVSDESAAQIVQLGVASSAVGEQGGAYLSQASVTQLAGLNSASVLQLNVEEVNTEILQTGEDNDAAITQTDGARNTFASILQGGDGNLALIDQLNTAANSEAYINQSGDSNLAASDQIGSGNSATIDQSGDGNIADTDQWGELNDATILQSGDFNEAVIVQDGSGNIADIDQSN